MIHLDTSFLIDVLRETGRTGVGPATRLLDALQDDDLAMSVFVACELAAGAAMARTPAEERRRVDQLCKSITVEYPDHRFSAMYASLLVTQERSRGKISTMDLLIATTAVLAGASLVTRNIKDFSRVPGLDLLGY